MRFFRFIIFIIILFIFPFLVSADNNINIRLDLSSEEVALNDTFQLFIVFKNNNQNSFRLDSLDMPGLENFKQIGKSQSSKTQIINGEVSSITEISLSLVALKTGEFEIGPLAISSGKEKVESNKVSLKVVNKKNSLFPKSKKNQIDLKTNKKISTNYSRLVLDIMAFLFLVFAIWYLYKQKKEKENIVQKKDEESKNKIKNFKNQIPKQDDSKFYEKIRILLYDFLEKEYNFKTKSLTSKELLNILEEKHLPSYEKIKEFLEICDRAHFGAQDQDKGKLSKIISDIIT